MHVKKLNDAINMHSTGFITACIMQEGIAHLFQVGRNTSKLKSKIEKGISKKKAYTSQHEK